MKVRAGILSDADREILFASNRDGRRVLVAAHHACVVEDQRGNTGCEEPMQAIGVCVGWTYDYVELGGWSFRTRVPWESAVRVWWRDEAPEPDHVAAIIAEHKPEGAPHAA